MECGDGDSAVRGGGLEEEQVMSEIHLGCPPKHAGTHTSHFTISFPPRSEQIEDCSNSETRSKVCDVDEDGDLIPPRRRRNQQIEDGSNSETRAKVCNVDEDGDLIPPRRRNPLKDYFVMNIQHNITSSIPRVGLQVWRAELVLADFVLHMMHCKSSGFDGIVAVELGAGTGLVGMLLARAANTVFVTDHGDEILENCAENINLNSGIFHHKASICVRELDWRRPWPPEIIVSSPSQQSYGWSRSDVEELQRASLLLAADVIYSDELTDAFFGILEAIMSNSQEKVLYLALEKRYNFSIDDLDVVANGYSHFRSYLRVIEEEEEEDDDDDDDALETKSSSSFVGRPISLEGVPKYVQEYNRGEDVEIWEIRYTK